jgi:ubiquitin-small subunit ribosomal protein S27Ae
MSGEGKKESKHKVYKYYKVSGDSLERVNITCPKCGPGFFMANHKNRKTCGKCHYSELNSVKAE